MPEPVPGQESEPGLPASGAEEPPEGSRPEAEAEGDSPPRPEEEEPQNQSKEGEEGQEEP